MHFHLELSSSKNFLLRNFKNKFVFLPISMKAKVRNVQCARKGKEFAEIPAAAIIICFKFDLSRFLNANAKTICDQNAKCKTTPTLTKCICFILTD